MMVMLALGIMGTLLLILIASALRFSRSDRYKGPQPAEFAVAEAADRLAAGIRYKTINTGLPLDQSPEIRQQFQGFHRFLEKAFPRVHARLEKTVINTGSLVFQWNGRDSGRPPCLLTGHMDVVPVREQDWTYPPFDGVIAADCIWGRGALDDKCSVLAILEAVEFLLAQDFQPEQTIYLAFGHDEESGGHEGAAKIAAWFRERNLKFDFVLDEGNFIVDGLLNLKNAPVALIGFAEKYSLELELSLKAAGGHASMPPRDSVIPRLCRSVGRLNRFRFPATLKYIRPLLRQALPCIQGVKKLILANQWLFAPLLKISLPKAAEINASMRTTLAPTIINGGVKTNVLPEKATAVFNLRALPDHKIDKIIPRLRSLLGDPELAINFRGNTCITAGASDTDSPAYQRIAATLRRVYHDHNLIVAPNLVIGFTDSRHYTTLSRNVYRSLGVMLKKEELKMIHGSNERLSLESYKKLIQFFIHFIKP